MSSYYYQTAFLPTNKEAKDLVFDMKGSLDRRKAGLKDATEDCLDRICSGFITQGSHPYEVLLKHVPDADTTAVTSAKECLVKAGYIRRTKGKNGYEWNPTRPLSNLKFHTVDQSNPWRIETSTGVVIQDSSYRLFPLEALKALNHRFVVFLEIPDPEKQLCILQGWTNAPSRRFYDLDNVPADAVPYPEDWQTFTKLMQRAGNLRGRTPFVPYTTHDGQTGWLTNNVQKAVFIVENACLRHWGRRTSPLMVSTDCRYLRKAVHPGLAQ